MRLPSFQAWFFFWSFFRTNPKVSERGLGWSGVGVRHVIAFFQRVKLGSNLISVERWRKKNMLLLQFIRLVDTVNLH